MKTPIIGVTCNVLTQISATVDAGIGIPGQDWQLIASDYVRMIEKAGGAPLLLPITKDITRAEKIWQELDGILVSGGNDVDPTLYKERIIAKCGVLDTERDSYEITAVKFAIKNKIPLLGICRGIQIINVALGGTLYQDLPSRGYELHTILAKKRNEISHIINIKPNSILHKILHKTKFGVNSFHHQGVAKVVAPVEVIAQSEDKVVEAISVPGDNFVLGVQWHPEMMFNSSDHLKIAKEFVKACMQ